MVWLVVVQLFIVCMAFSSSVALHQVCKTPLMTHVPKSQTGELGVIIYIRQFLGILLNCITIF